MRVSVVVPVYNTGPYIADLIASLRAQTLAAEEFEVVFVDDGSTDGTPALLDRVAAETPNFRVLHTPNSGWPGRPRNIGIDAATGDWVFLADHDDRFDPEALERLTDFAAEHGSDVVIGRIVGVRRSAPDRIFARTVVDAQTDPGLLMTSLTPQKLYRRAFLNEQDIRFPEGRRRLEDHLFVTKAYLRARRVSIYADHPVYYFVLRDDGGNASRSAVEWAGYFAAAAESIAVVDAEAPDEVTRLIMRSRWLRTEAIGRLRGQRFLRRERRNELLAAARDLIQQHYPAAEVDRLAPPDRLIGRLLLDGREEDVVAFAEWEASIRIRMEVLAARLEQDPGLLRVHLRAEARPAEPLPDRFRRLPASYPDPAALERVAVVPSGARLSARLRRAEGAAVETRVEQAVAAGVLTATAELDLAGQPIGEGTWRLRATVRGMGRPRTEAPRASTSGGAVDRRPLRIGNRRLRLLTGPQRGLLLRVERTGPVSWLRRAARAVRRSARR